MALWKPGATEDPLTDRSRLIGTELGEVTFPVEEGKIREFAKAVLDDGNDGVTPTPTFLQTTIFWEPEGGPALPDLGLDYLRVLHGEQEFEYLAPIRAGDRLTATSRIGDVYEKQGRRGGAMTFVVFENEYRNQRGEKVAVSRMVVLEPEQVPA